MNVEQLKSRFKGHYDFMVAEKFLDEQFSQLQQLQDESTPDFAFEVVSLFFEDCQKIFHDLDRALEQPMVDFKTVDNNVHTLKGSSSSIGAARVTHVCIAFRSFCDEHNLEGCLRSMQELKRETALVKNQFEILFKLEQQLLAAGGSITLPVKPSPQSNDHPWFM
ncbi:hypothetical protein IFM89_000911 [Coptis chinensis]|uniref:Histidine-containing phosphotransfer protein n=1 Tax=Coptis chinensis TaxID=261450 RepID=A0A835II94_9MAGN|nr:hypothetical protein IFM89_000911 [Coptis chinensis]